MPIGVPTRRRLVSIGSAQQKPGESDAEFEARVSRSSGGQFTSGSDANNGPNGSTPSSGPAPGEPALGTTGPAALGLVQVLQLLGASVSESTTVGPEVVAALVAAQRELGVEGENGFLGPKTRAAFRAKLGLPEPSTAPKAPTAAEARDAANDAYRRERDTAADQYRRERDAAADARRTERDAARQARETAAEERRAAAASKPRTSRTPAGGGSRRRTKKPVPKKKPVVSARAERARRRMKAPVPKKPPAKKPPPRDGRQVPKSAFRVRVIERKNGMDTMERKSLGGTPVDVVSESQGITRALVSVTGWVDAVNDEIVPGAYARTLKTRKPKGVDAHTWERPVAKALSVTELMPGDQRLPKTTPDGDPWPTGAGGLEVVAQFNLNTTMGRDTFENVKFFGTDSEWSIGYNVPPGGAVKKGGVRYIKDIDLFEFSPVLFGAASLARTAEVKGLRMATEVKHRREFPGSHGWVERCIDSALSRIQTSANSDGEVESMGFSVEAVFPDYALVCRWDHGETMYQVPYTITGEIAVLGPMVPVDVATVVTPQTPEHLTAYDLVDQLTPAELAAMEALRAYLP